MSNRSRGRRRRSERSKLWKWRRFARCLQMSRLQMKNGLQITERNNKKIKRYRERVEETSWKPRTCSRVVGFPALYAYIRVSPQLLVCFYASLSWFLTSNATQFDRRSFRSTKVDSIEDYCLNVVNLLFIKSVLLRIFLEPGLQGTANSSLSIELFCCRIFLLPIRNAEKETPTTKEIKAMRNRSDLQSNWLAIFTSIL